MKNILSGYVNLLKTAMGSGIISFPFLFKTYGTGVSIALTCFFGIFTFIGLNILNNCSKKIAEPNLSTLTTYSLPSASKLVTTAIFIKCLGVSISYLVVVRELLPNVLGHIFLCNLDEKIVLTVFLVVFSPICYFNKIDKLKFTSFLGLVALFFILISSLIMFGSIDTDISKEVPVEYSFLWFENLSKFVFAFTCHMNFFSVLSESNNNTRIMKKISLYVVLSALITYLLFGYSNYKVFGNSIKDNVLSNYPDTTLTTFSKFFYVMVMVFSYPLQVNPCRKYFLELFEFKNKRTEKVIAFIVTTLIILITYLIAISGIELGVIYKIIGATSSTLMCLILPALFYLKLECNKKKLMIFFSYFSLGLGALIFSSTVISLLVKYLLFQSLS